MELVIHGDISKMKTMDSKLLSNTKHIENIRKSLAATGLKGRINLFPNHFALEEIETVDGINFTLAGNYGSKERLHALTAWIIIHRMHHSLLDTPEFKWANTSNILREMEKSLLSVFPSSQLLGDSMMLWLTTRACTMQSARTKVLFPLCVDIAAEIFTQFVFSGDIKFKPAKNWTFDKVDGCYLTKEASFLKKTETRKGNTYFLLGMNRSLTESETRECDDVLTEFKPKIVNSLKDDLDFMMSNVLCY